MRRLEEIILPVLDSEKDKTCYWYDGKFYTRRDMLSLVSVCEDALYHSGFSRGQRLVVMLRNSPLMSLGIPTTTAVFTASCSDKIASTS